MYMSAMISHAGNKLVSCPFVVRYLFNFENIRCKYIYRSYSRMSGIKILFPGQGSQYVGMTTRLQPFCPGAEKIFTVASSVLGYDVKDLCVNGPDEKLQETVHCQPAVVISSLVALEQIKHNDPMVLSKPVAMAGFSVGEITALIASGSIALDKGLELVRLRATLMQAACKDTSSGMATIIGLDEETVAEICHRLERQTGGVASIANYIFPKGFVVSADTATLEAIIAEVTAKHDGASIKPVNVSGAFHSSLMSTALPKMKELLETIEIKLPSCPVYSNVTGEPYGNVDVVKNLLAQQVVKPVRWEQCMRHMIEFHGADSFIEVGPGKQLKAMLKRIDRFAFRSTTNVEA